MIKTIIVENEPKHIQSLERMLTNNFPDIKIVSICETTKKGIDEIKKHDPDLVFLDVELDEKEGGFRILKETQSFKYKVIFTTAYDQHAKRAFKFSAVDFLEKPIDQDELILALERFKERTDSHSQKSKEVSSQNINEPEFLKHTLVIPVVHGFDFISVSEIIMCQAANNYCEFFQTGNKPKVTASKTLGEIADELNNPNFYRSHRSYLINLNYIKKFRNDSAGATVEMNEGHIAYLSRAQKEDFLKRIGRK